MLFGVLKEALSSLGHRVRETVVVKDRPVALAPSTSEAEAEQCRLRVELMPNFAEAHVHLGVALKNLGRLAEAEAAFRRALSLHGNNVVAHYNLGVILAETSRPCEAEEAFRNALRLLSNFVEAYTNLGIVLLRAGRVAEAEAALRRALELKPDFRDAQKHLTIVLQETKRLTEAEARCRCALELAPDSAERNIELGIALTQGGRFAEAETAFRRAIDLDRNDAIPFYRLGVVLAQTARPGGAEAAFRHALELRPDFFEALHELGGVLAATHRSAEAEKVYRRVIELRPDYAEAHNGLGFVLKVLHRLAEAEAAFHLSTTLKPDFEPAHRNLSLVRKEIRHLSEEEEACRRAVRLSPDSARAQYKLGSTLMALGKFDQAKISFEKVVAIESSNAQAYRQLGLALMRREQIDRAVGCFLRAISVKPDFAKCLANLGTAYSLKQEFLEAERCAQAALAIDPNQMEANEAMATILLRTGRGDEAKQYLDRASRRPPVYVEYASNPIRTVLLLWTKKTGNVPTMELLFPGSINTRINWVIESAHDDESADLPDHDLAFNAMGDPDLIGDCSDPLNRFAETYERPLLNHPTKVALTARDKLPALLSGVENIVVPAVWRFASSTDWPESLADHLPLLIRPVDSHGGAGLVLAKTPAELAQCRSSQTGPVYICRFVDFRSEDSWYRKYRMIFVDRKTYPYHLAISQNWMVHYFSADMESNPWKVEEEKMFLQDPETVIGTLGIQAVRSIGARMDLEYAGIDFSILPDKRILVFEANPMMLIHPEGISGPLEHKNAYVFRIQDRFEEMLERFCRRARVPPGSSS